MLSEAVEYTEKDDPYYDYCLWEYSPVSADSGKLRSSNLLFHSFDVAGVSEKMGDFCRALRKGMGPFNTVWGVKWMNGSLSWEFYFYDYQRLERERSISRFLDISSGYFKCKLKYSEQRPYFMFSVDIDEALLSGRRELDELNIYIGNIGSNVSSGICYSYTENGLRLDNFYFFFDAATENQDIIGKISSSAHLDLPGLDIDAIMWPEMLSCKTIVVANKKHNEGIYFSRIGIDQLIMFLSRCGFPEALVKYLRQNRHLLDHLLYDVGYDYIMQDKADIGGDGIEVLKASYYGIL